MSTSVSKITVKVEAVKIYPVVFSVTARQVLSFPAKEDTAAVRTSTRLSFNFNLLTYIFNNN